MSYTAAVLSGPYANKVADTAPELPLYPTFTEQELLQAKQAVAKGQQLMHQQIQQRTAANGKVSDEQSKQEAALYHEAAYVDAIAEYYLSFEQPYGPDWRTAEQQYAAKLQVCTPRYIASHVKETVDCAAPLQVLGHCCSTLHPVDITPGTHCLLYPCC